MRNKLIFILMLITFLIIMDTNILAQPFNFTNIDANIRREELIKEINGYEDERGIIKKIEDEIQNMQLGIEYYDNKIESYLNEIETINSEVLNMESEIYKISEKINHMNNKVAAERTAFHERTRDMYINGTIFYMDILFKSEGFLEFFDNIGVLQSVVKYNDKIISDLVSKENDLKQMRDKYDKDLGSLKSLKVKKEDRIQEFEEAKEEQKKMIAKSQERREYYISILPRYREIMDKKQKEIENVTVSIAALAIQRENEFYSRGENKISSSDIVAYSAKLLGKPYQWGGIGPDSFDCSGYVKYVYAYFGIELKRTTYEQCSQGIYVDRKDLKQGDLVFFGYGAPHHVGIYVGNDCYIHAPTSGDYIRVSHLSRSDYFTARRLF